MQRTESSPVSRLASTIGRRALQSIAEATEARVNGASSRGLFVQTSRGGLFFLSCETAPGPLTVNIVGDAGWVSRADGDVQCIIEGSRLRLQPSRVLIRLDQARAWAAPDRRGPSAPPGEQRARLRALAASYHPDLMRRDLAALLEWIADGLPDAAQPRHPQAERASLLRQAVAGGQALLVAEAVRGLLGWGSGLTPSGDDFLLGLLLGLHRSGGGARADELRRSVAQVVGREAGQRTNAVSVSLLECAADGDADERLIDLVDHVQCGHPGRDTAEAAAGGWGASSGWDVLAGVGLTIDIDR